jgi:hypothetical protein
MKTLFEILPTDANTTNNTLILEVGDSLVSAIIKQNDPSTVIAFAIYQLEHSDTKQISGAVQQLLEEKAIFKLPLKNVKVISAFHQSVLVPFSLSEKNHFSAIVDMIHGDLSSTPEVHSDLINEDGVYNVYKMPDSLSEMLKVKFPDYQLNHLYTSLLKFIPREEDKMHLIFYPGKVIVFIVKGGKSQLINTFDYQAPEDVSYLLLNLCKHFDLNDIPVEINGLIEEDSSLFKEIFKYFSVVNFTNLPEKCTFPNEINNFPSHYFSHQFAMNLCE